MLMNLRLKMGVLSGHDWTLSKFAYEKEPERKEIEKPEWMLGLELAASDTVEVASHVGDTNFLGDKQWQQEIMEKLAVIQEQEQKLPFRPQKKQRPKLPAIKPRPRVRKVPT